MRRELGSTTSGCSRSAGTGSASAPADAVEADAAEPHLARLEPGAGLADEHEGPVGREHVAAELGETPVQPDVDRSPQMAGREVQRVPRVEDGRAASRRATTSSSVSGARRSSSSSRSCACRLRCASNEKYMGWSGWPSRDEPRRTRPRSSAGGRSSCGAARRSSTASRSTGSCRTPTRRRGRGTRAWRPAARAASRAATGTAARPSSSGATPDRASRSGRPTSPMNIVSPVSTPYGTTSSACSRTTMLIDSGVCPGVASTSSVDVAERSCSPSTSGSIGKSTCRPPRRTRSRLRSWRPARGARLRKSA